MTASDGREPRTATVESVLRDAWEAFHPGQAAPLGWLTHTTARIHEHLRAHRPAPDTTAPPTGAEEAWRLRRQVWQTLRDAAAKHTIDLDVAEQILHGLDLPGLPRRWQVRLTVPLDIEVTAASRDDAIDTAEDAIDTALGGIDTACDWSRVARDDATPGDLDTSTEPPADLR